MERLRTEMAGTIARRHPDRARAFRILFSHRHVHHSQHCVEFASFDLLDLPTLGGSAAYSAEAISANGRTLSRDMDTKT